MTVAIYMYIYMCVYICVYIHTYILTYIHTYICVYVYIYTYMLSKGFSSKGPTNLFLSISSFINNVADVWMFSGLFVIV